MRTFLLILALLLPAAFHAPAAESPVRSKTVVQSIQGSNYFLVSQDNLILRLPASNVVAAFPLTSYRVVVEGDSFSTHQTTTWAAFLSNRAPRLGLTFLTNASVGGDTISNIVLTTTNTLGPWMPTNTGNLTLLLIQAGYNDIKTSDSAETVWQNISNVWRFARNSGALVAGFTLTEAATYTPRQLATIADVNQRIRQFATNADYLIDSALLTGNPNTDMSYDGTHWTTNTNERIEAAIEAILFSRWPPFTPLSVTRELADGRLIASKSNSPAAVFGGRPGATTNIVEFYVDNTRKASVSTNGGFRFTAGTVFFPSIATEAAPTVGWDSFVGNSFGWAQGSAERLRVSSASGGATLSVLSSGASAALQIGSTIASGGVTIWAGTGTPEAVVTANIGSLFLRSDGGASTTLYVKESGTGNTGWVAK